MNTADRSITQLDTALRRRFEFKELMPGPELLKDAPVKTEIDLVTFLTKINERIEYLFDREHQIGHAYFMGCETKDDVDNVMRHKVIPLLVEYFYEDWNKVVAVLEENKPGDGKFEGLFIDRVEISQPPAWNPEGNEEPRYRWTVKDTFGDKCYPKPKSPQ
jgi:5-methylcytosine-specific restriction protein B